MDDCLDLEIIYSATLRANGFLPLDFKESLPPKLAARYLRLHRGVGAFLKKVMTLQADLAGESF